MKTVALIIGTRPDIIKLAPLAFALQRSSSLEPLIIATGQHDAMADQATSVFGVAPDIDLQLMKEKQTPNQLLGALLPTLETALDQKNPDIVVVQGDTTSALGGALCAYHRRIDVAHVEAGLRTHNFDAPFPEEMNRTLISRVAQLHFCPTESAFENLRNEGITQGVHVVGNTVVDALQWMNARIEQNEVDIADDVEQLIAADKKFVLVTGHRRENFHGPMENLCRALAQLIRDVDGLEVVYPVHLNPNVQEPVYRLLGGDSRIHLLQPVDYPSMLQLMKHCALIISDSGGIQEEAPSFGTKVLVTRETTERPEAINCGAASLVPLTDVDSLVSEAKNALAQSASAKTRSMVNPFGDGTAAQQIVTILKQKLAADK